MNLSAEFIRDAAGAAAVFGFFASSWFGWAQENPPSTWRRLLAVGAILSLLTAIAGGVLTWKHWSDATAFNPSTGKTFGIIVGIEFGSAALGSGVLYALGKTRFIPVWIALVVGVHLFPIAPLLHYPLLYVVAALLTIVALVAIPLAYKLSVPISAITGVAMGTVLLLAALFSLTTMLF